MGEVVGKEQLPPQDLSRFTGQLKELVAFYIRDELLPMQEAVDVFADILSEAAEIDPQCGNKARIHITFQSLERIETPLDLHNDPGDKYGMKTVVAGTLLGQLVRKE